MKNLYIELTPDELRYRQLEALLNSSLPKAARRLALNRIEESYYESSMLKFCCIEQNNCILVECQERLYNVETNLVGDVVTVFDIAAAKPARPETKALLIDRLKNNHS